MQQPYQQQPSGAGAVKMVMIDSERGVLIANTSRAATKIRLIPRAEFEERVSW